MRTLPDYLRPKLDIVSVGLNPSIYSVEQGFYFARAQNRFWKALNGSKLVPRPLTPGKAAIEELFREHPHQLGNRSRGNDRDDAPRLPRLPQPGEPADFETGWFSQHGSLGKAHSLFGEKLKPLIT